MEKKKFSNLLRAKISERVRYANRRAIWAQERIREMNSKIQEPEEIEAEWRELEEDIILQEIK